MHLMNVHSPASFSAWRTEKDNHFTLYWFNLFIFNEREFFFFYKPLQDTKLHMAGTVDLTTVPKKMNQVVQQQLSDASL